MRLSNGLLETLKMSASKRKRNVSREIEHRLSRSLVDDRDDERTRALMRLLRSVLRSTMGRKMSAWLDDPQAFDQGVIAINTVLELIRPMDEVGVVHADGDVNLQGAFNARATLADVQTAPAIAPASASGHRREMALIRQAIGDVIDRAIIHGKTAEQLRVDEPARSELVALRRKEALSVRGKAPALAHHEAKRMKALISRLVRVAHHPTTGADDGDDKTAA